MRLSPWLLCVAVSPLASGQGFESGMFGSPATVEPIEEARDFVAGDLTGDGRPDVIGSWSEPLTNMVLVPSLAGGGFAPAIQFKMGAPPVEVFALVDVDADGLMDVVAQANIFVPDAPQLLVRRGLGGGALAPTQIQSLPDDAAALLLLADLQGDGLPDLVVPIAHSFSGSSLGGAKGHGDGTFGPFGVLAQTRQVAQLAAADVDLDGDLDLLELGLDLDPALVIHGCDLITRLNDGDGTLQLLEPTVSLAPASGMGEPGDHDLDGVVDVLVFDTASGLVTELEGLGDGHFAPLLVLELGVAIEDAVAADLDLDGSTDVAVVEHDETGADAPIVVQRLDRWQPLGAPLLLTPPGPNRHVAATDFDGDGLPELAVSVAGVDVDSVQVFRNELGPVADLGHASGGPVLALAGVPAAGHLLTLTISPPGPPAPALLVLGTQALPQAFFGATLIPVPLVALSVSAPGSLAATWPAGVPEGALVYLQAFAAAGAGAAGSNVLLLVPQP